MILCEGQKLKLQFFAIYDRLFQFAEQQTLNFFSAVLPLQLQNDK